MINFRNEKGVTGPREVDYLTCGRCLKEFPLQSITLFIEHKKLDCNDDIVAERFQETQGLQCFSCPQGFMTAVGLLRHAQIIHNLKLFLEKGPYFSDIAQNIASDPFVSDQSVSSIIQGSQLNSFSQTVPSVSQHINQPEAVSLFTKSDVGDNQSKSLKQTVSSVAHKDQSQSLFHEDFGGTVNQQLLKQAKHNKFLVSGDIITTALKHGEEKDFSPDSVILNSEEIRNKESDIKDKIEKTPKTGVLQRDNSSAVDAEKCCSAVVPKKRKHHIETKHMPYPRPRFVRHKSSGGERDRGTSGHSGNTIFIDLEPDAGLGVASTHSCENQPIVSTSETFGGLNLHVSGIQRRSKNVPGTNKPHTPTSKGSLILKPGSVYSIPIQYNMPTHIAGKSVVISQQLDHHQNAQSNFSTIASSQSSLPSPSKAHTGPIPVVISPESLKVKHKEKIQPKIEPEEESQRIVMDSSQFTVDDDYDDDDGTNDGSSPEKDGVIGQTGNDACQTRKRRYPTTRPFKCEQCDHAFNQRIHLKKHMSKHTGIKPYKCQQCDYSTVERSHLKVHIRIHTGEKPFKCTYCEYATAQNSTLKIHLKRHHGNKMVECHICGQVFDQTDALQQHESGHQSLAEGAQQEVEGQGQTKSLNYKERFPGSDIEITCDNQIHFETEREPSEGQNHDRQQTHSSDLQKGQGDIPTDKC